MPQKFKPILAPTILLASALIWVLVEHHTIQAFASGSTTGYTPTIESLSDLGVPYRQVHPLKHHNVHSHRAAYQNANFLQLGISHAVGRFLLLRERGRAGMGTLMAVLFCVGMGLAGRVHGGPRERYWGTIGWHWMGFGMASVGGNLNSVLTAAREAEEAGRAVWYRVVSLVLGVVGLGSLWQFSTLGTWNFQTKVGLWQRGSLYPVLVWQVVTAVAILMGNSTRGVEKKGKKRA